MYSCASAFCRVQVSVSRERLQGWATAYRVAETLDDGREEARHGAKAKVHGRVGHGDDVCVRENERERSDPVRREDDWNERGTYRCASW